VPQWDPGILSTFVAALRHDKMVAPNGVRRTDDRRNVSLPMLNIVSCQRLKRNDIVVIDNLRAHKVAGVREAIETGRATLRYLASVFPRP